MPSSNRSLVPLQRIKSQLVEKIKSDAVQSRVDGVSGTAESTCNRLVFIYKEDRVSTQSGYGNASKHNWNLTFDVKQKWENALMGWTSSGDPLQGLVMKFESCEDAVSFADKSGFKYIIKQESTIIHPERKSYADNFKYSSGKLKVIPTK